MHLISFGFGLFSELSFVNLISTYYVAMSHHWIILVPSLFTEYEMSSVEEKIK